jgi:hypothetical protein
LGREGDEMKLRKWKQGGYYVIKGKLNDWTCKEGWKVWFDFWFWGVVSMYKHNLIKKIEWEESWREDFSCAKNVKKRSRVVTCVFLGPTQGRGWACLGFLEWLCGSLCMMFLGILNWVWNVFCLEKSTCCFVGTSKVFGIKRMLGVVMFGLVNDVLLSLKLNPLEGPTMLSCGKLGLGARSRLPALERGRGSC